MVKKAIAIGIVSLFVIGGLLGIFSIIPDEAEALGPPLADSQWPKFRGNMKNTGLSPYDTSGNNGEFKWSFETDFYIKGSPAIGPDGTIYVGSFDKNLYAINPDGTEEWHFTAGDLIRSTPAISSDGTIYFGSYDNKFYALNPDGTEKWSFLTGDNIYSSPAIGADGTIYFGSSDYKFYAIYPDGTEKWNFSTPQGYVNSCPAFDSNGTIYIGSLDDFFYAINPNGTEKWNFTVGDQGIGNSAAIGSDGTLYFGTYDNKLVALNPDGTEKWIYTFGTMVQSSPAIGPDGTIYIGCNDKKMYAISPDGTKKWSYLTYSYITQSPAIGSEGTIYFASTNVLYAANPDGSIKWTFGAISPMSSPAIDSNGTIYIGSEDTFLYAIGPSIPNRSPSTPSKPSGPIYGETNVSYFFSSSSTDPDGNRIKYGWDWDGDGIVDEWSGLVASGTEDNRSHSWTTSDNYDVKVKAQDEYGGESGWSDSLSVTITEHAQNNSLYFDPLPPSLSVRYNSPYTFNYTYYIQSLDTPLSELVLTTNDPNHASINGLEVTYLYPQSMAGETVLIILTISDDSNTSHTTVTIIISSNWAPQLIANLPDVTLEGNSTLYDVFDLDDYFFDMDNDSLFYSVDFSHVEVNINVDNTVDFTANGPWTGTEKGTFRAVDPAGAIIEDTITVTVVPESAGYLEISSITLSEYSPSAGDEMAIYVEIINLGTEDCFTLVKVYDGDPNNGGTQLGTDIPISILGDGTGTVSVNWMVTSGNHTIYVIAENITNGKQAVSNLPINVEGVDLSYLVLTTGDINIYRFEPGETRTISVDVTCYLQTVNNVRLKILDHQNLTIDHTITPPRTMYDGETTKFYLRITAPELPEGVEKLEKDIVIQVVGDNGIFSNAEELDIVVSKDAVSFFNPVTIAGAVATGSLATLGAAAAASRRSENWKYLLLLTFAVPLYTRIHGKKTLDNFVRGQVFGHIQSTPGTHFNEIKKTLQLGNGNLAYHLQKLEKEGFIKSKRDKRYRRFYPVGVDVLEEDGIKLSKTQESILDYIERNPKSDQKKIGQNIIESQQTISYNINVLVREGFLVEEKFKGTKRYEIMDENT